MKTTGIISFAHKGIVGATLLLACVSATADTYTFNLGENDAAGVNTGPANGPPQSVGVTADGYVGGHSTLAYALANNDANQLTVGDVLIYCDPAHTVLMDVIRFEDFGVGYAFIYSTPAGGPNLADTGLPSAFQANTVSFTQEFNGTQYGLFDYTPTNGQPGFSTGALGNPNPPQAAPTYIYDFTSDATGNWSAPEGGATAGWLGMALIGMLATKEILARKRPVLASANLSKPRRARSF